MKKWFLAWVVLLIALAGCQAPPSPEDILVDMESALNAGGVDAAMAFFREDAVVKLVPALPPGSPDTYSGAEEIRGWFEELGMDSCCYPRVWPVWRPVSPPVGSVGSTDRCSRSPMRTAAARAHRL